MAPQRGRPLLTLLMVLGGLLAIALWRLNLTYDLGYFLPAPMNVEQQVLVERLGNNPGSDLIFVQLPGSTPAAALLLAARLRLDPAFTNVWPAAEQADQEAVPDILWRNRLLLGELPTSTARWQQILADRVADISSAPDAQLLDMLAADPALLSIGALIPLQSSFDRNALANADPPLLVLRAAAGAFDIDAQVQTYAALQLALDEQRITEAQLYGSGIYSVELQRAVRSESIIFSLLASVALAALILWRFRSLVTLLAAALPLAIGGACGLLVLSLAFEQVHGITLAFGFTLLGVALDYPLHVLTHKRLQPDASTDPLWSTLRLGVFSTIIAYGAFLSSGTGGLMQLGLFASIGIATAALSTRYLDRTFDVAAQLGAQPAPLPATAIAQPQLSHGPWLLALAIALPLSLNSDVFNDDLGAMTPVPRATLAADSALRANLGTIDLRHVIAVRNPNLDAALRATEALDHTLAKAAADGMLERHRSVSGILPSRATQQERRALLQAPQTRLAFIDALQHTPFTRAAFDPFIEALQAEAERGDWLERDDLEAEPLLAELLNSQLYRSGNDWVSLVYLTGLQSPQALAQVMAQHSDATLIDLKQASVELVQDYRQRLLVIVSLAAIVIGLLLWHRTGNLRRAIWLLGTMSAAVLLATAGKLLLGTALSLFDLMALALVAGLGLDYALFFSRDDRQSSADGPATRSAVTLCALSSLLVFGILSLSSIPLLNGIGSTVAMGVSAAWLLARLGRYENPAT